MISISADTLEQQDISLKRQSEFLLDGVTFTKKMVVSKKRKKDAIKAIEEYAANHLEAILIEHKLFFSVWLEKVKSNETDDSATSDIVEISKKAIDLLGDRKMVEERLELEDLLSSQLKEFGI